MCGIVGAVSSVNVVPVLVQGLQRLEYRGYDSCGVAVHAQGLQRSRSTARVAELLTQIEQSQLSGGTGIAHTRWATHGAPAVHNAHPHFSHGPGVDAGSPNPERPGRIALVHNGIIENHDELRESLQAKGYHFSSQTDTEVIAHLIGNAMATAESLAEAVRMATAQLVGSYALGVVCVDEPDTLIATRNESPLVIGFGDGEHLIEVLLRRFEGRRRAFGLRFGGRHAACNEWGLPPSHPCFHPCLVSRQLFFFISSFIIFSFHI